MYLLLSLGSEGEAGVPVISRLEVTDVTTRSFSVFWITSEPSIPSLLVYQSDCATPASEVQISVASSDATGIQKATAAGLLPDTNYCFQTATTLRSTGDTAVFPPSPVVVKTERTVARFVQQETKLVPFANDLLRIPPVYLPAPADSPEGIIAMLSILGSRSARPLSVFFAGPSDHYANLNNLFDSSTGESLDLVGGERMLITELHGASGCTIERYRKVPADNGMTRARDIQGGFVPQDLDCNDSVNILDILRAVQWFGSSRGAACFNADADLINDGTVDILDILNVVGSFNAAR
ncbi:MAG: hypothetical protein AB1805_01805 [Nitrospirota bacterium]